jgi:hypothetical protein
MSMMKRLSPHTGKGLIRVELSKGTYLLLTVQEYVTGIQRGKRERRFKRTEAKGSR